MENAPREFDHNFRNDFPEIFFSIRFWTGISGNFGRMERAPTHGVKVSVTAS